MNRHLAPIVAALSLALAPSVPAQATPYEGLMQDVLINADLWSAQPEILSAALGFEGIIGVLPFENAVRAAGGTWIRFPAGVNQPALRARTSAPPAPFITAAYNTTPNQADAMPIVFSWPVLPSTVHPSDFLLHLSDGSTTTPDGVSIFPCHEFNERNCVVLVGEFSNRLVMGEAGAIYPTRVEIVDDGTPMMLVGPGGQPQSAVGLTRVSSNPYEPDNGPRLVGAKLSLLSLAGEGAPAPFGVPVNDGRALYGNDAEYRLRVLTSGGFSPNGVSAVTPDAFARFFRLLVDDGGATRVLTATGIDYTIPEGTIRIVGLAETGPLQGPYDLSYVEDFDNYIDIILKGDRAAMRKIQAVEIPATMGYDRFYNPGGPGNDPTPGVRYTQPGPADVEPVLIAIDDPMTTTYPRPSIRIDQATVAGPVTLVNEGLVPGRQYFNLFSLDLCAGGPGTGSGPFGSCIVTAANEAFVLDQLALPVGTIPFHFVAGTGTEVWGPFAIAPVVLEALCLDVTGGEIGIASPIVRLEVR